MVILLKQYLVNVNVLLKLYHHSRFLQLATWHIIITNMKLNTALIY